MRPICLQGRLLSEHDLKTVRDLIADNPRCGRTALSLRLCQLWDWRNHAGRLEDMAARTLLLKLHARDLIALPPPKRHLRRPCAQTALSLPLEVPAQPAAVQGPLAALQPVRLELAHTAALRQRTRQLLGQHHYLGFHGAVGENVQYLIRDARGAELAVMVFGAAAWKVAARDRFIGWSAVFPQQRSLDRALALAFGLLCGVGKRTVTRAISFQGNTQKDWSADYKVFSRSPWEERALFHPILQTAIAQHALERIVISADDTRVWRNGKHVPFTQWHYDPMGPPFQTNLRWGHRFLQASLVLPLYHQDKESSSRSVPVRFEIAPVIRSRANAPRRPSSSTINNCAKQRTCRRSSWR